MVCPHNGCECAPASCVRLAVLVPWLRMRSTSCSIAPPMRGSGQSHALLLCLLLGWPLASQLCLLSPTRPRWRFALCGSYMFALCATLLWTHRTELSVLRLFVAVVLVLRPLPLLVPCPLSVCECVCVCVCVSCLSLVLLECVCLLPCSVLVCLLLSFPCVSCPVL